MIEWAGGFARFAHVASGTTLVGILVFCLIVDHGREHRPGPIDWLKPALALDAVYLIAAIGVFAAQLAAVAGTPGAATDPAAWARYALDSRFGLTWLAQHAIALVLLVLLASRTRMAAAMGRRVHLGSCAALAALAVPMSALAGHGAGGDAAISVPIQCLHILAAGCWVGGLPVLFAQFAQAARNRTGTQDALAALRRFSLLAGGTMLCLIVTGALIGWLQIAGVPALLGTPYGHLLLVKLALLSAILVIAAHIRWRILPRAAQIPVGGELADRLPVLLGLELLIAWGLIAVASRLADTPPAIHDQIVWPLSIRLAPDVTWPLPGVKEQVIAGLLLALAGVVVGLARIGRDPWRRGLAAALAVAGLMVAAWPLTVAADRDTYRLSSVPYDATSIANGERLFQTSCAACHGTSATGDGPAAAGLPRPPADLTAPHVRDHTAGDMFAWISNGMSAGGMPAFAELLAEDERWDLVNFVHTTSMGYRARVLRETIVPRGPWVVAPDFAFVTTAGAQIALQNYRERAVVLLVLFALPGSEPRLRALHQSAAALAAAGVMVIAVPIDPGSDAAASPIVTGAVPVTRTGNEIVRAYMLFRRTLANQRFGEAGPKPRHMEFLIDRYGFLRARWLPEDGTPGWDDLTVLLDQARALTSEGRVRALPDGHLH